MRRPVVLLLILAAVPAMGRVISYAPYTSQIAIPAVQSRLDRHFVLTELPADNNFVYNRGQLVVYDTKGLEEPRVVFPADGSMSTVNAVAAREDDQQFAILVQTSSPGESYLSVDGGANWKKVQLPGTVFFTGVFPMFGDTGGPFVRGRFANVLIGTHDVPFIVAGSGTIVGVRNDGTVKTLLPAPAGNPTVPNVRLIGASRDGSRFLYIADNTTIQSMDLNGNPRNEGGKMPSITGYTPLFDGWITDDGGVYVEMLLNSNDVGLYYLKNGATTFVNGTADHSSSVPGGASPIPPLPPPPTTTTTFFAIPFADYSGAWMIQRNVSKSTILYSHTSSDGLVKRWEDITVPEVEALHAAQSGTKVLVQVHRPRQTLDQMLFKDPALAIWHVGDPAPAYYDELFLAETAAKGFVHLDVDKMETGDPFVFDSGAMPTGGGGIIVSPAPPPTAGGSDVVQEWGVVRASLQQRLVLPGAARTAGAFNSYWLTDVTFYNPSDGPVSIQVQYAANGSRLQAESSGSGPSPTRSLTLTPHEIRTIPDVLKNLFGFESGAGALYITPEIGTAVNVTSRTYTQAPNGTFGFGMNAIDVYASASPRFPVTFSGAFLGANYRTNLVITDVSGRGSDAALAAWGPFGPTGNSYTTYSVPSLGQQQFNFVNSAIGLGSTETGALIVQPTSGEAVASVFAVDNRTNDSTYFPPDIPASVVRVIPAIGHLDGANGSKFRTDLYMFNNSGQAKVVTMQAKVWDSNDSPASIPLTLLPHEARVIPDVLMTAFNRNGIARLRYWMQGSTNDTSVRVTSRTYNIDPNGGTYGFLMPPLNSFQSGSPGDTLEILGASLDKSARTNLGLIDLMPWGGSAPSKARVSIVDDHGKQLDSFEITLPNMGGNQINDLFHARNLPESPTPVLVRVTVINGAVGAYLAVVDNGTNDPSYFAANLGAKQ